MIFRRAGFTAVSVTRRLNGGAEPSASAKKQLSQSTPVSRTAMICPSPCKPWSNSGIGPKAVPDWRVWIDSSFAKSGRERRRRTTANNLRIGRYERSRQARLIHEVTGNGSQVTGGVRGKDLSPVPRDPSPESMHELPPVADVIGQDVLAQPIRRRVEGAAAVDLREWFDEVHQQRIGGQHERRDRDTGAAAAVGLLERAVDDLHVEAERVRVEVPISEIPFVKVGPYHTNTKAGLELAQRILRRRKHNNKQIFMITDGKPSALTEGGHLYTNSFGLDMKIVNRTLEEADRCRRANIPITTFMLATDPMLVNFIEQLSK